MHTYRLTLVIGSREHRIVITADSYIADPESGEHIFHLSDTIVAWVPSSIIIDIAES